MAGVAEQAPIETHDYWSRFMTIQTSSSSSSTGTISSKLSLSSSSTSSSSSSKSADSSLIKHGESKEDTTLQESMGILKNLDTLNDDKIKTAIESVKTARSNYPACEEDPYKKFLEDWNTYLAALAIHYKKDSEAQIEIEPSSELPPAIDVGKKFIDLLDDVWNFMKGLVPEKVGELISYLVVGIASFLLHLSEGYEGTKMALHAYNNKKSLARDAKIVAGVGIFAFAGVGAGLSISYIAAAAGAAVSGAALMPFLVPAFLTGIYCIAQWRRIQIHKEAKDIYVKIKESHKQLLLKPEVQRVLTKADKKEKPLSKPELEILAEFDASQARFETAKKQYWEAKQAKNSGYLEVFTSAIVLVGTALTTAALVGAAVAASMGTFGLALLIGGVLYGFIGKMLEKHCPMPIDDKKLSPLYDPKKSKHTPSPKSSVGSQAVPAAAPTGATHQVKAVSSVTMKGGSLFAPAKTASSTTSINSSERHTQLPAHEFSPFASRARL